MNIEETKKETECCCGGEHKRKEEKMSPIIEFTSLKQAYECLHEWKRRLFLEDWIIKLELLDEIKEDDGSLLAGQCANRIQENKTTLIRILKKDPDDSHFIKFCAEEALLHELLHLKLDMCSHGKKSVEDVVYEWVNHQIVSQMAYSFIMTKYGLNFDWFKDFKEDDEIIISE